MSRRRFGLLCAVLVLGLTVALPITAQAPAKGAPQKSSGSQNPKRKKAQPPATKPALPETLTLATGEVIPLAEFVPRSETALTQLQQILSGVKSPEIKATTAALNALSQRIAATAPDAKKQAEDARSTLQLTESKIQWNRDKSQLDNLDKNVARYTSALADQTQQLHAIRNTWDALAAAAIDAKLPEEFLLRIGSVQNAATAVDTALREESNRLIGLQVELSGTRKLVVEVLDAVDISESALREQIFVLDSPPLWSAFRSSDWPQTKRQIASYFASAVGRSASFLHSYRSKIFVYLLCWAFLLGAVIRLCKQDLSTLPEKDVRYLPCVQHPYAITALLALAFFGVIFVKHPLELGRVVRLLTTVPFVIISFSFIERKLRPYVAGLAVAYLVETFSLLLLGGTQFRRIVSLIVSVSLLTALVFLLKKGGLLSSYLPERELTFAGVYLRLAAVCLAISTLTNILGNVSLSDTLEFGTILSMYWGMLLSVFFAVFLTLTAALTVSPFGQRSRAFRLHGHIVVQTTKTYLRVVCWIIWFITVLLSFQFYNQALTGTTEAITRKWHIGAVSISLLDVVLFFLVLLTSNVIAKFIRFLLNEEVLPRTSMDPGAAQAGSRLTYSGLLIIGMVLAFGAAGFELSKLTVLTGAFGVGLGFGLQNLVSNFVSGIILSLERPMKVGDLVEVDNLLGEVTAIGFRASTVRTFDGADVIVPNSDLITKSFVNWSLTDRLRRTEIQVGVAYGSDPDQVLKILTRVLASHQKVVRFPEPLITFDQFGDSALVFTARFWSKMDDRMQIRSELNVQINQEFKQNNIEIPFPQRDVNLKLQGEVPGLLADAAKPAKAGSSQS